MCQSIEYYKRYYIIKLITIIVRHGYEWLIETTKLNKKTSGKIKDNTRTFIELFTSG